MNIETIADFNKALEAGHYAFPGGYPLYFITAGSAALSFDAAIAEADRIREAIRDNDNTGGWRVVACEVNWEDPALYCDHTNARIPSAYAEND